MCRIVSVSGLKQLAASIRRMVPKTVGARGCSGSFALRALDSPLGACAIRVGARLLYLKPLVGPIFGLVEHVTRALSSPHAANSALERTILRQRRLIYLAILGTIERAIKRQLLSQDIARRVGRLWARAVLTATRGSEATRRFRETHGCDPPLFVVISPGNACNLHCSGCYASAGADAAKLDWPLLDRLITEAKELWGVSLFVFSGGEPLLYRSDGRDLLDIMEKHADSLFLMFTNGTLIDDASADRLARLGNLTPALSVEGFREETDNRRGAGTYDQVIGAMARLRRVGLPFGISITATRENAPQLLSDDMLDLYFGQQGAFYGFVFPYSPIGSDFCIGLMPSPEQSVAFLHRSWEVVARRHVFLLDFWNHGPLVEGCIAGGRARGYLHIDWNGNVMPCVFFPYVACNVREIYGRGGSLDDVWHSDLLRAVRRWQAQQGFGGGKPSVEHDWLSPCPFRDHYADALQLVACSHALPQSPAAAAALRDEAYRRHMIDYGRSARRVRRHVWETEYQGKSDQQ